MTLRTLPRLFALLALLLQFASMPVQARQRLYSAGPSLNLVGGGNNNPRLATGLGGTRPLNVFYGVYPSLTLTSTGASSAVSASYRYGSEWTEASSSVRSESHSASVSLGLPLSRRWNLTLSESFSSTADTTSFNTFSGATPQPQPSFVFNPVAAGVSTRTNDVRVGIGYALTTRSTLGFNASYRLRTYDSSAFAGSLSDQQGASIGFNYALQTSPRETWSVGFTTSRYFYQTFNDFESQGAFVGYSNRLAPDLTLQLTVGATRAASLGAGGTSLGVNTAVSLEKALQSQSFVFSFSQASAQSSGLGSGSDTRRASVLMRQALGRVGVLSLNVSGFDAKGILANTFHVRGLAAAATIGVGLTDTLSIAGGGQFQRNTGATQFVFTQKRFFMSLNYSDGDLWQW